MGMQLDEEVEGFACLYIESETEFAWFFVYPIFNILYEYFGGRLLVFLFFLG